MNTHANHALLPRAPQQLPFRLAQRWLWMTPAAISIIFIGGVIAWAVANDAAERAQAHQTLIADALSVDEQLHARIDAESTHLRVAAEQLRTSSQTPLALITNAEVMAGLRRFWLSVTWLDSRNQVVASTEQDVASTVLAAKGSGEDSGLSMHLKVPIKRFLPEEYGPPDYSAGALIVRYSPTALLKRGVPWWRSRKYDVQLLDRYNEIMASTAEGATLARGEEIIVPFTGQAWRDTFVQLISRDTFAPWYKTQLLVYLGGFLCLAIASTALLYRQVQHVTNAEASWRAEVAWRRAMEESALVGLRARDMQGRIMHVNRTFCEFVGFDSAVLIGLSPPMPFWRPEETEEALARNKRTLAGDAPREGYLVRWRHQNGNHLDVLIFESPLINAHGEQMGWMGSIVDVTKTKQLEERERHQINISSHHARLTMLGEVASTLAHQLNQPLTAILSYAAGIENSLLQHQNPDQSVLSAIGRLASQAGKAGMIVKRIRAFLTRRAPQYQLCSLNKVVNNAIKLLHRDFELNHVRLIQMNDQKLPRIMADPILIEQVILNLLRNSADALASRTDRRVIHVASQMAGTEFVRLTVSDNGLGLAGRTIESLCEPFYTSKPDGMGMGLAICRSIVEAHHGVIDAWDAPDGGAVFSLSLKINAPKSEEV